MRQLLRKKDAASAPPGKRIYAIGDIHGCLDELNALLSLITTDLENRNLTNSTFRDGTSTDGELTAQLIFLGDYIDRGPDSKGVIERLCTLKKAHPNTVFLKGNHEACFLDYITDPEDMMHWLDWGGTETLASYGLEPPPPLAGARYAEDLSNLIPKSHITFLNSLALTHIEGDYLFVHAGLRPGVALAEQREEDLLWIRKRFHNTPTKERPSYTIIHGHDPVKKPANKGWRINVDTGACWSGQLTCVVLEGEEQRFLST